MGRFWSRITFSSIFLFADSFCHGRFFGRRFTGTEPAGSGADHFYQIGDPQMWDLGLLRGGRINADCQLQKLPIVSPSSSISIESIPDCTCRVRDLSRPLPYIPRGLIISGWSVANRGRGRGRDRSRTLHCWYYADYQCPR